ncbi:TPA: hypothetical protein ACH3X2_000830 [Trebouxia sp. C0005]
MNNAIARPQDLVTITAISVLALVACINAQGSLFWGVASSAYQFEGAVDANGRGPTIWDTFSHTPGRIADGSTADIADDFYDQYLDDINLMQANGIKNFRFSIAWSRIYPTGTGQVNQAGLAFYSNLTDALLAANIQPFVTLFHWDLPQSLQDSYGGFLGQQLVTDFANYASTVVAALGNRVTYWTTFNEPNSICSLGFGSGGMAPGRCSDRSICADGDSDSEPYICAHTLLAAHGAAVSKMRAAAPEAKISINWSADWVVPYTNSTDDTAAAQRHVDFTLGLYADPVYLGDYPQSVKALVPSLPALTDQEKASLKGSVDYFALNHYTSYYVKDAPGSGTLEGTAVSYISSAGVAIGEQAESSWLYVVPWGFSAILQYIDQRYGHPDIIVTENGVDVPGESNIPYPDLLHDPFRINYIQTYLEQANEAKQAGVKLLGYFYWAFLDNFEWAQGYSNTFGLVHVDYSSDNRARAPKDSLAWLAAHFA